MVEGDLIPDLVDYVTGIGGGGNGSRLYVYKNEREGAGSVAQW